jgi:hypothetical protein
LDRWQYSFDYHQTKIRLVLPFAVAVARGRRPRPMLSQQTAIAAPQSVALPTTLRSDSVGRNSVEPERFTPR